MTLLAIAAALVGWGVVLLQGRWLDSLEGELADARQQESVSTGGPSIDLEESAGISDAEPPPAVVSTQVLADLQQLKEELEASKAERNVLNQLVFQSETKLQQLRAELDQKTQAPSEPAQEFRTLTRTRMRAGPTTEAQEIAVIAKGASLQVIDTVQNGTWHEVRLLGYAFNELLEPWKEE